uniref:Nitrous oxide reductase n=1 Tax=Steinernema glaseri TaxID=37863 RepID=A0A1I7XX63_9BILA
PVLVAHDWRPSVEFRDRFFAQIVLVHRHHQHLLDVQHRARGSDRLLVDEQMPQKEGSVVRLLSNVVLKDPRNDARPPTGRTRFHVDKILDTSP